MAGKEFPGQRGFPTPDDTPLDVGYLLFKFPDSNDWAGLLLGAAQALTYEWNWYNWGEMLPDEAADRWEKIVNEAPYNLIDEPIPAPYYEDGIEADDELPASEQIWYGYVSEGNFIEDVGVFAISNFLAATISPQAAVLYATHQRKIRLSFFNGGGIPGVIKVYVQEILAAVVDLTGDTDEIIDVEVLTGYVDEAVEVLQVLEA